MTNCYACRQPVEWACTRCPHCTTPLGGFSNSGNKPQGGGSSGFLDLLVILVILDLLCLYLWPDFTGALNQWLYTLALGVWAVISWMFMTAASMLDWIF